MINQRLIQILKKSLILIILFNILYAKNININLYGLKYHIKSQTKNITDKVLKNYSKKKIHSNNSKINNNLGLKYELKLNNTTTFFTNIGYYTNIKSNIINILPVNSFGLKFNLKNKEKLMITLDYIPENRIFDINKMYLNISLNY